MRPVHYAATMSRKPAFNGRFAKACIPCFKLIKNCQTGGSYLLFVITKQGSCSNPMLEILSPDRPGCCAACIVGKKRGNNGWATKHETVVACAAWLSHGLLRRGNCWLVFHNASCYHRILCSIVQAWLGSARLDFCSCVVCALYLHERCNLAGVEKEASVPHKGLHRGPCGLVGAASA